MLALLLGGILVLKGKKNYTRDRNSLYLSFSLSLRHFAPGTHYAKLRGPPLSLTSRQHTYKSAVLALGLTSYPPQPTSGCSTRSHHRHPNQRVRRVHDARAETDASRRPPLWRGRERRRRAAARDDDDNAVNIIMSKKETFAAAARWRMHTFADASCSRRSADSSLRVSKMD